MARRAWEHGSGDGWQLVSGDDDVPEQNLRLREKHQVGGTRFRMEGLLAYKG